VRGGRLCELGRRLPNSMDVWLYPTLPSPYKGEEEDGLTFPGPFL